MLRNFIYRLRNLIYPPKCILCKKVLTAVQTDLCDSCRSDGPECILNRKKIPHISGVVSVWYYKDYPRLSILRYKFSRYRHYAHSYGRLLAMRVLTDMDAEFDLVTWVTPSIRRQLRRGFDHGHKLAKATAKELELPVQRTLRKVVHNGTQSASASAAQRRANVLGAYKPYRPKKIKGKQILLVDDVVTTGSTASECAKTLMLCGASAVYLATVATTEYYKK